MSYDTKIKDIRALLEENNEALPKDHKNRVDVEGVIGALKDEAPTEKTLAQLREGDKELRGIPEKLARAILAIASGSEAAAPPAPPEASAKAMPTQQTIVVRRAEDELEQATDADLIARYNIENPGSVGRELDGRAKGQPFLVPVNGKIDVDASAGRLGALRRGRPVTPTVIIGGMPIRPLMVGEPLREEPLAENPLYPGEPLAEETCLHTNLSWTGVPREVRALLYLAVLSGECRVSGPEIARMIIREAKGSNAIAEVSSSYPNAAVRLRELPERSWPSLEIDPAQMRAEEARRGRPFEMASWKVEGACRTILLAAPGDPNVARLDVHLAGRKRRGQIETWIAGQGAGGEAEVELMHRIQSADLVLLFLSPAFMATMADSASVEAIGTRVRAWGLHVIPILSEPVDLAHPRDPSPTYWFERLTRLPREGRALSAVADRDSTLAEMASTIGREAERLQVARQAGGRSQGAVQPRAVLLTHEQVLRLHRAAVQAGLSRSRSALLGGIPLTVADTLPSASNPSEQLLRDISELGSRSWEIPSGSPILTWLANAIALAGGRGDISVFEEMIGIVSGRKA